MRTHIIHIGAEELTYEIRNIIRVADKLQELGVPVYLENIGDPVAKGEKIPVWMKEIVPNWSGRTCVTVTVRPRGFLKPESSLCP